ncbi:hypothetical protein ANO11243_033710 [Dothideomycetidae sp. 11243]|nr:hypothetical protein ANO11243_033710 [fungal sp. No.11243]
MASTSAPQASSPEALSTMTDSKSAIIDRSLHDRLSLPFGTRLVLALTLATTSGFALGTAHGGQMAGLRFRAENAHRLPTSEVGWFLYHKSKNYNAMLGGVKEGFRMGVRLGFWGGLFFWTEEGIDRSEEDGTRDFLSTTVAALSTAGAFSAWNRFPLPTAARTAKMGLKAGLAFGLIQDALGLLRGRKLGYVEFIKRAVGTGQKDSPAQVSSQPG